MPEFYSGTAGPEASQYEELIAQLWAVDPVAAMWFVDTGLFLEQGALFRDIEQLIQTVTEESADPLRVLISENQFKGRYEAVAIKEDSKEDSGDFSIALHQELDILPEMQVFFSEQEEKAKNVIDQMINNVYP